MKLTKAQRKQHDEALKLLESDKDLSMVDREFIVSSWKPGATNDIGRGSAFFTPWDLAHHLNIEVGDVEGKTILDLCAGIGILSLHSWLYCHHEPKPKVTCVEINPDYVAVGKRLFPEAEWIQASVFDLDLQGRRFDHFISNPPFGTIPKGMPRVAKKFEYAVAEIGMKHADFGTMIIPAGITDWRYSGRQGHQKEENRDYQKWMEKSGLQLAPNCGIDCSLLEPFADANITVEITNVEYVEDHVAQGSLF